MFMFRKREIHVSTSEGLREEAKKFQSAVAEVNSNFVPSELNIAAIESVCAKFETNVETVAAAFEVYLRKNAIEAIKKIKSSGAEYSFLTLEETAAAYGFELDDLGVSYFAE